MSSALNGNPAPIPFTDASTEPVHWRGGIPYEADGSLCVESFAAVVSWNQGLPFSANHRICYALNADVDHFGAGATPFDGSGFFAISENAVDHFANGVPYDADSRVAMTNVGGPPAFEPLVHFNETSIVGDDPVTQWNNIGTGGAIYDLTLTQGNFLNLLRTNESGLDAVQGGGDVSISTNPAPPAIATPTTEFLVVRHAIAAPLETWVDSHSSGASHQIQVSASEDYGINQGIALDVAVPVTDTLRGIMVQSNQDATTKLSVSDGVDVTGDAGSNAFITVTLFADLAGNNIAPATICEYALFTFELTPDQTDQVIEYLDQKWNTDPPLDPSIIFHWDETGHVFGAGSDVWTDRVGGLVYSTPSGVIEGTVNGLPCIEVSVLNPAAPSPGSFNPWTDTSTIFVVGKMINPANTSLMDATNFGTPKLVHPNGAANFEFTLGSPGFSGALPNDELLHVYALRFDSTESTITGREQTFLDSITNPAGISSPTFDDPNPLPILFNGSFNAAPIGNQICEIIYYQDYFDDEKMTTEFDRLVAKWGV